MPMPTELHQMLNAIQRLFLNSLPISVIATEKDFYSLLLTKLRKHCIPTVVNGLDEYPLKRQIDFVCYSSSEAAFNAFLLTNASYAGHTLATWLISERYPVSLIKEVLLHSSNLHERYRDKTLLMLAIDSDYHEVVQLICELAMNHNGICHPSVIDAVDNRGYTSLMYAVERCAVLFSESGKRLESERILLKCGANTEIVSQDGKRYAYLVLELKGMQKLHTRGAHVFRRAKSEGERESEERKPEGKSLSDVVRGSEEVEEELDAYMPSLFGRRR